MIDAEILSVRSGRHSYGHRFHAPAALEIAKPSTYAEQLGEAYVIARFEARRDMIRTKVDSTGSRTRRHSHHAGRIAG